MKIGFDAKRFFNNKTGLGSYSRNLINSMIKEYPQHEYYLYTPDQPYVEHINKYLDISNVKIRCAKTTNSNYWRSRGILKNLVSDEVDIYHGLSNEIPFGIHKTDIKTVVTIHDLLFKQFPEDHGLIDRMIYDWKSKYACLNADKTVAISYATKASIDEHYHIDEENISVIYQDIDPIFHQKHSKDYQHKVLSDFNIHEDYILFVGTDSERKNLITLLRSLTICRGKINLVLVLDPKGLSRQCAKLIHDELLEDRIKTFVGVSLEHLSVLYKVAKCLVYPSLGEGWGLPIEEAIACNTPVIITNTSPFNELPSPLKLYVEQPRNPNELAKQIDSILTLDQKIFKKNDNIHESASEYHRIYMNLTNGKQRIRC